MPRPRTFERRLFAWLLGFALLPTLLVLAVALAVGARSLSWLGTLGPWSEVAESGRSLLEAAEPAAARDTVLGAALERHRETLSSSLLLARRWSFLGGRVALVAPLLGVAVALALAGAALWLSRRLARELSSPVQELVRWSERMARGEPLPEPSQRELRELQEVRVLRGALRDASVRIAQSRRRELEHERTRTWGEMARRVAHEMKNPLTPLRLAARRLREMENGAESKELAGVVAEETARLEQLAGHFSALGRPADGPISTVDLEEMLAGLLRTDVPPPVRHRLRVAPGTATIEAYYEPLLRAFRNLLRNAVEAVAGAEGGGEIEVEVAPGRDGGVRVVVADNGAGIAGQAAERIFEPDYTGKPGGTGLGLAVVRHTVSAHGGEVTARPRHGGGAEFIVLLPAAPAVGAHGNGNA